jgi:hypothetical protein
MAKKQARAGAAGFRRLDYKGHAVLIPEDRRRKKLFIDGRTVIHRIAGDTYYLSVNAYDRAPTLEAVIKRYLDYADCARRWED